MKLIKSEELYSFDKKNVIALGNFDGVHIAHQKVLAECIAISKQNNANSLVYVLDPHPMKVLTGKEPLLLTAFDYKMEIFSQLGLDIVYIQNFDLNFASIEAEDFVKDILVDKLNAQQVIAGFDYTFGKKAKGNIHLLKQECAKYGVGVYEIEEYAYEALPVSSTIIRNKIMQGNMQEVTFLLNRPYCMQGTVVKGRGLGRKIGYPTANVHLDYNAVIPKKGVYKTRTYFDNAWHDSITNIGVRPTINSSNQEDISIETHIIDKKQIDLYGKLIRIQFISMLREEIKYDTLDELISGIEKDILLVKSFNE